MPCTNGTDPSEVRGITMPARTDNLAEQVRRADQTSGKGCSSSSQSHADSRHGTSGGRPPDQAHPRDEVSPKGEGTSARSRSPKDFRRVKTDPPTAVAKRDLPNHSEGSSTRKDPSNEGRENARSRSPRDASDVQRPPRHSVAGGRPPDPSDLEDDIERPVPIELRLDGALLHRSHSFGFYRGVYWCWRCQGVASVMPRKLADPCSVPSGATYSDRSGGRVGQLSRKQLPSNMRQGWPLDEDARPHPDVLVQNQPQRHSVPQALHPRPPAATTNAAPTPATSYGEPQNRTSPPTTLRSESKLVTAYD